MDQISGPNQEESAADLDQVDVDEIKSIALQYLDAGNLVTKLMSFGADKIGELMAKLPADWQTHIGEATETALQHAYDVAFTTHADDKPSSFANRALHWLQESVGTS